MLKPNTSTRNNSCSSFLSGGATVSTRVEIFKLSCRPPAFVISAVLNWLGVFVIGTTFPFIVVSASASARGARLQQPRQRGTSSRGDSAVPLHSALGTRSPTSTFATLICPRYSLRLKCLSEVKRERIPYQVQNALGPKHKKCAKKVTKGKICSSCSLSHSAFPCRKDSSTSASSSLWWCFSLQG